MDDLSPLPEVSGQKVTNASLEQIPRCHVSRNFAAEGIF
jgi:hypothetical protein